MQLIASLSACGAEYARSIALLLDTTMSAKPIITFQGKNIPFGMRIGR